MHSPSLRFELTGNSLRHRELSYRASSSDGSDHRRHFSPELYIPNMDSRNPSVWPPLLSQPILLVPQRASHANVDLGSDQEMQFQNFFVSKNPKPKILENFNLEINPRIE